MKIEVPKMTRPVDLGEYAGEMAGQVVYVWVNPREELLDEYFSVQRAILQEMEKSEKEKKYVPDQKFLESQSARIREIIAELLSQGPEATRWTAEEVSALVLSTAETDPQLYPWLIEKIFEKIVEHRKQRKKA